MAGRGRRAGCAGKEGRPHRRRRQNLALLPASHDRRAARLFQGRRSEREHQRLRRRLAGLAGRRGRKRGRGVGRLRAHPEHAAKGAISAVLRAARPRAADRDRHFEVEELQIAERLERPEDRGLGAGLEQAHDPEPPAFPRRTQALGRFDHRRRPDSDRGHGAEKRPDRRGFQYRPGHDQARAGWRRQDHRRHPHLARDRAGLGRSHASGLPLRAGRFHSKESGYGPGAHQRHRSRR